MAIEHINNEEPLVISNADQIFDHGISNYLNKFIISDADAACLTIDSVHPRWSYVKTDGQGNVIEASEKRPISRNAIAGIYLYKKGSEFIKSAMQCIKNGSSIESRYYTSLVFNEYILRGKEVAHYSVPNEHFHSFYSPQRIEEYESTQVQCKEW